LAPWGNAEIQNSPTAHDHVARRTLSRLVVHLADNVDPKPMTLLFVGASEEPMRHSGVLRRGWQPAVAGAAMLDVTPTICGQPRHRGLSTRVPA
jgi:hypothetical protein